MASDQRKETVILVHGTFANPNFEANGLKWYQPGHRYCEFLDAKLASEGSAARCWSHLASDDKKGIFWWTAGNSADERAKAATDLRAYLQQLSALGWRTHIVAHSHGGNVVLDALGGLRNLRAGMPSWFDGKIVLHGTPILLFDPDFTQISRLYMLSRFLGIFLLWWAIIIAAGIEICRDIQWSQLSWQHAGILFGGLAAVGTPFFLYFLWRAIQHLIRNFSPDSEINRGADPMAEHLLVMNSEVDEAYQILLHTNKLRNPLLALNDQTSDTPKSSLWLLGWLRTLVGLVPKACRSVKRHHLETLKYFREADSVYFQIDSRPSYLVSVLAHGVLAAGSIAIFCGWQLLDDPIAMLAALVVAVVAVHALRYSHLGSAVAARALPYRVCNWVVGYPWRMILAIGFEIFDRKIRDSIWYAIKSVSFGVLGSPYRPQDYSVHLKPPILDAVQFTYLELPRTLRDQLTTERFEVLSQKSKGVLDELHGANPTTFLLHPDLLENADVPLVHFAYYNYELPIAKTAEWLAAPLRMHPSEVGFSFDAQVFRIAYREDNSHDAKFDDNERSWPSQPPRKLSRQDRSPQ